MSIGAVALGAKIIERHFTFDRQMEGPDHAASLENEFSQMVEGIREVEQSLGSGENRVLSQGEMINRENLSKSLVAACDLKAETVIRPEHIKILSPGQGLSPQKYNELIGKKLRREMASEDYFYDSDLLSSRVEPGVYKFNRPWGIPVDTTILMNM